MLYDKVYIDAISYELPTTVVTTEELEERIEPTLKRHGIPKGHISAITGIKERRWWPENFSVADGATVAAKKALDSSGISVNDIDAVVYTGVCREYFEPATAAHVAGNLGVKETTLVYDISNACIGMLNGIIDLANRIELGQIKAGLVVSCESAREINEDVIHSLLKNGDIGNFSTSIASLTGGSGAAAILVTDGSFSSESHKLIGGVSRTAPEFHNLCRWGIKKISSNKIEQFMSTDAPAVLKNGLILGSKTWQAMLEELNWCKDTVNKIITHQIGKAHRQSFMQSLELSDDLDYQTFAYLGNMGTVSIAITAAIAAERQFLKMGDKIGLLGIGSGLNCMMLGVEW
jgi:3-oxoacyl-[acyl-carrier-protein] synthase-3